MLCCGKKSAYSVEEEEAVDADKKDVNQSENSKSKGDQSEVTDKKGSETDKKNESGEAEVAKEVVESPVEVKVTEAVQSAPNASQGQGKSATMPHGSSLGNSKRFTTQSSISSQLSTREDIYRSRDQFFSRDSLYNESLQEDRVSQSLSPNERFIAYQRRYFRGANQEYVMSLEQIGEVVKRLESVASRLETLSACAPAGGGGGGLKSGGGAVVDDVVSPSVLSFDAIVKGDFAKCLELSNKIGGDLQTQAGMVKAAFQALRDLLVTASKCKKPNDIQGVLKPLSDQLQAVQTFRENNRSSPLFNHLSTLSESIPALGWVAVAPTPGPYVKDMQDAGMFFSNRVIKDYKEKDQTHVDWTKAWMSTLREMIAYIKEYHTTGLTWNPQGVDVSAMAGASKPPAPAAGGPPPPPPPGPPPPPPPAVPEATGDGGAGGEDARAALFASINKGGDVTQGLKHVSDDMKTHKNPALKASTGAPGVRTGPKPFKAATQSPPPVSPKPMSKPAAPAAKPPVLELQDKKWMVEYQVGNKGMVIEDTNIKQTVYLYKCQDSTLQVKGKVNSITIDSCKKVAVAFESVVSSIEFVNSQSIQAQVMGKCPTVSIDKTDGCMMYLSKDSLDAEIVTAKSSEMNILVPTADGDFTEFALPEQYKTTWNGKKFTTSCTESV